jgi:hypothetical protein
VLLESDKARSRVVCLVHHTFRVRDRKDSIVLEVHPWKSRGVDGSPIDARRISYRRSGSATFLSSVALGRQEYA